MDEVQITTVRDRMEQLKELDARRAAILKSLDENKHLTPELKKKVEAAETVSAALEAPLPALPPEAPARARHDQRQVEKGASRRSRSGFSRTRTPTAAGEAEKFVTAADAPEEKRVLDTKAALAGSP